jgi:hypothetical protein
MPHTCDRRVLVLLVVGMALGVADASAYEPPPDDPRGGSDLRAWLPFYKDVASRLDFRMQDRAGESLTFEPEPVLVYSHPSGLKGTHGSFYVWTREGRPEVVGSIWSYKADASRRTIVHEFDSLADSPLVEMRIGQGVWSQRRVIGPRLVPGAPAPASSPRARTTQVKQLAARFEGSSTTNGPEIRLRMLPRPLYHFQSREGAIRDCALFGFFADWDPEIMLLIESRETPDGPRWHFSPARFNICPMWLDYEKKRVWKVEREPSTAITFGDPAGPFFVVHEVASQPAKR